MMVALLLYSYAIGERTAGGSSGAAGRTSPVRVICANRVPDHATIARFRARHEQALAKMFTQVLGLCGRAGLVSVGLGAVDGTPDRRRCLARRDKTYRAIREEVERILGEAARADAADDERLGEARGDELPAELGRRSRRERLRRCREQLEADQAQAADYEANLAWRAEWEAEHGRKLGGRKPFAPNPDALAERTKTRPIPTRG